jgi:hypothetical protein
MMRLPSDSAERIFLYKATGWMGAATTVLSVMVAFFLRETRAIGPATMAMVVLLGAASGVAIGWLIWWGTGKASRGFVDLISGAGNLPPAPSFSFQESLVARGRYGEAVESFTSHLGDHPNDHDARFALARILAGPVRDPDGAARVLQAIRAGNPSPGQEFRASQELIDLYQATGNRGRLLAELARFADRYRDSAAGAAARRSLLELKREPRDDA